MVRIVIVKAISCYGSYSDVSVEEKNIFDGQNLTLSATETANDILIW